MSFDYIEFTLPSEKFDVNSSQECTTSGKGSVTYKLTLKEYGVVMVTGKIVVNNVYNCSTAKNHIFMLKIYLLSLL